MGIYSNNGYMNERIEDIQEAYGYDNDEYSAQIAMIESYQNSFMIFDGVIRSGIQESAMRFQGVDEAEVMAFSEGVIGDLFNKIKEFFKKLWAKLKSIFHNFMAKWDAKFGKSNKEFIKKYRKDIYGKDLSDFEVEYRKLQGTNWNSVSFPDNFTKTFNVQEIWSKMTDKQIDDQMQKEESDELTCKILESTCGNKISLSNSSEYEKEFMDYVFDESSKDNINLTEIVDRMMGNKDFMKELDKCNKSLNKAIGDIVKQIDKDQAEALRLQPLTGSNTADLKRRTQYNLSYDSSTNRFSNTTNDDDQNLSNPDGGRKPGKVGKSTLTTYQKALNLIHKRALSVQTAASKYTACTIKAVKFCNAQDRRIIAKVVAYKRKEEAFAEDFADLIEWESDCVGIY